MTVPPSEWVVIRVDGITVAQGYQCVCGVIGCRSHAVRARLDSATVKGLSMQTDPLAGFGWRGGLVACVVGIVFAVLMARWC